MGYMSLFRAVAVRLLFTLHGVISIWRLTIATRESRYWYLGLVLCLLLVEMTVTLGKKSGKEWKWFCPSVFIYLMCVVPTIWFLELSQLEKRLNDSVNGSLILENETEGLTASFDIVTFEIRIPILLTSDKWIRTLEQLLLLILILGRWFLPKGKLTHDQLSQLLLVYIGTAADIVEFFEAFTEEKVRNSRLLCIVILGIWTLSLLQFSLVLTATRVRRDRSGLIRSGLMSAYDKCCSPDDLPFLVLRMLLIFKYYVLSYTNMFFTCKNTIVIVLLIYRLVVVQLERKPPPELDDITVNMLPRFASSPAIFDHHVRRSKGRIIDSMSLSNSNTLSTCSTRYSNKSSRYTKPYSSCGNIYEVKVTAANRHSNTYSPIAVMEDFHSPV
ncbi:unnamed protein product [Candidula unifasciata]|uniref:Transmembrane protein 26 n=1 Tax=Candidula unifasciata TaxID=100452 RepID=A0A8S3YVD1_9EUPU|nr:unnamed protein product [Candidula unifasciata]